jgi:hypothetical protein
MDEVRDRGGVGLHNRTPEQVGFVDLADVTEPHTATDKLGDRRQNEHVDVGRGAAFGEVVDETGVRAGDGDDEGAGAGQAATFSRSNRVPRTSTPSRRRFWRLGESSRNATAS